jgi:hypothetical protein
MNGVDIGYGVVKKVVEVYDLRNELRCLEMVDSCLKGSMLMYLSGETTRMIYSSCLTLKCVLWSRDEWCPACRDGGVEYRTSTVANSKRSQV